MAEPGWTLRITSEADASGVAAMKRGVEGLTTATTEAKQKVEGLGDAYDDAKKRLEETLARADTLVAEAKRGGEAAGDALGEGMAKGGASKWADGFNKVLDVNQMVQAAWSTGTQIGTAIGDGITRAAERGGGWKSFFNLDGDEVAAMEQVQSELDKVRAAHAKMLDQLNRRPDAFLEWLDEAKQTVADLISELQTVAELGKIDRGMEQDQANATYEQDKAAIQNDPSLTPAQKAQAQADLDNRKAWEDQERRDAERDAESNARWNEVEVKRQNADELARKAEEQKQRAADAAEVDRVAGERLARNTALDGVSEEVRAQRLERYRQEEATARGYEGGIGSGKQESADANRAVQEAKKAREDADRAEADAERKDAVSYKESARDIDATLRGMDQRNAGAQEAADQESAAAARQAGQAMEQGSQQTAGAMKQMADQITQGSELQTQAAVATAQAATTAAQAAAQATAEAARAKQTADDVMRQIQELRNSAKYR